MANRVLLGNRSTGGYGLYVSKAGENVLDTTETMIFDPRTGSSPAVKTYGQDYILWNGVDHTITHNLGYNPLVAIRWSFTISGSAATAVYSPCWSEHFEEREQQGGGGETFEVTKRGGLRWYHANTNSIVIQNQANYTAQATVYYAYIIFYEPDYTGGLGI